MLTIYRPGVMNLDPDRPSVLRRGMSIDHHLLHRMKQNGRCLGQRRGTVASGVDRDNWYIKDTSRVLDCLSSLNCL